MKNVLITGGTKGIGLETAKKFLSENFRVSVCASTEQSVNNIKNTFPGINTYLCDMSQKNDVINFAEKLINDVGRIDVLVNNVGKFVQSRISDEADGVFEDLMQTNLFGTYYLTRKLLPAMIKEKSGTIFNICSTASIKPYVDSGSYCISKYALLGFSKVLREELKEYNIRVISVLPGATLTASWDSVDLPSDRLIPPEDIAGTIYEIYRLSPQTVIEEILIRPLKGDL